MLVSNSELSFHVHRKSGIGRQATLYTVGVWKGSTLHAICHVQPIEGALASIRFLLEQVDEHDSERALLRRNKPTVSTAGALRKLKIGAVSFFAALLRPLR